MKVIFTIVAKNYLSLALTLADSIKKQDPTQLFYILLADHPDGLPAQYFDNHKIFLSKEINIPKYEELAFKYNVTEFCTAIKPFFIDFLIQKGAEKIIYLDPDIYVYQKPEIIFQELNNYEILITPHIISMEESFSGAIPETEMLFSGIYNLGFIAVKNTSKVQRFISWWKNKLADYCYGDRMDSLHVDQKWIDFIPSFFTSGELKTIIHPGYNIAYWNIHERVLDSSSGEVRVSLKNVDQPEYMPVIFMHYSGLDPRNIYINKQCPSLKIDVFPAWKELIVSYADKVKANGFDTLRKLHYSFNSFQNGEVISFFHRRIFRKLLENNNDNPFTDPFKVGENTLFEMFKKNKLLLGNTIIESKVTTENLKESNKKLKNINRFLLLLKKLLGLNRYLVLLRFCQKYFRPENQIFLLKEYRRETEETYFEK